MGVFRYACRDKAHLFLGASEAADEEIFEALDKKHRIFVTHAGGGGESCRSFSRFPPRDRQGINQGGRQPRKVI